LLIFNILKESLLKLQAMVLKMSKKKVCSSKKNCSKVANQQEGTSQGEIITNALSDKSKKLLAQVPRFSPLVYILSFVSRA
jgi:hypothetical protein